MRLNIPIYSWLLLISFLFGSISCKKQQDEIPPNIILIMADDLGYNELGCYGQQIIQTPYIDRLAEEGMRFTQFYSGSPVCAPSRCVLLTGLHSGHSYVRDNYELGGYTDETEGGQLPLPAGTITLGSLMKSKGYKTAVIGKWGLGGPDSEGIPTKQGFDYFYGYLCQKQAHNYYPSHLWENEKWDTLNNEFFMAHQKLSGDPEDPTSFDSFMATDYAPDKMMEKATDFIRNNKDTSFFLYLPVVVPHLALQVPEDEPSLERYRELIPDTPYIGNKGYLPHPTPRAAYAAMITRMDRNIGRIMELLKENGLAENTLVLFTSDNGPTYGGIGGSDTDYFESNNPFKGLKGSVYEGGLRVPFIAWWPGRIAPQSVSDHIASFQDLLPTFNEIYNPSEPVSSDGISLWPAFSSEPGPEHPYLYWEFPAYGGQLAIRAGKWKLVGRSLKKDPNSPFELYNLEIDESEKTNLADEFPEVLAEMEKLIPEARNQSEKFPFPALDSLKIYRKF